MKTLEHLVLRFMRSEVTYVLDPLQFAYQEHTGVEDAVFCMLHWAYTYLEEPGCYVRILFFDFSSAFNTIHHHIEREVGGDEGGSLPDLLDDGLPDRTATVCQAQELCFRDGQEQHWCSTGDRSSTILVHIIHGRL